MAKFDTAAQIAKVCAHARVLDGTLVFETPAGGRPFKIDLVSIDQDTKSSLRAFLYSNFYAHDKDLNDPDAFDYMTLLGQRLTDVEFLKSLKKANPAKGYYQEGWKIVAREGADVRVARDGITLAVDPEKHFPAAQRDAVAGQSVPVRFPAFSTMASTGFFVTFSELGPVAGVPITRFYLNVAGDAAGPLMQALLPRLLKMKIPYTFKTISDPKRYTRRDATVLYVGRQDYGAVARELLDLHHKHFEWFREGVPGFTLPLAKGIGVADNPAADRQGMVSFGEKITSKLAEVILKAANALDPFTSSGLYAELLAGLQADGLDPGRLYLSGAGAPDYEPVGQAPPCEPSVALVSMPWVTPTMPSIQLATVASILQDKGLKTAAYEFYLDYVVRIGLSNFSMISETGGFIEEWLFAKSYYGRERGEDLESFRKVRPGLGLPDPALEETVLDALFAETEAFLDDLEKRPEWANHDVIGFSLTFNQTAASMALAQRLKRRYPRLKIIFGGTACAGPMARAMLEVCPYIEAAVAVEAEHSAADLINRLRQGKSLKGLKGVIWRDHRGTIHGSEKVEAAAWRQWPLEKEFDTYFNRKERLGLTDEVETWLPFESSRGCWWGEKHQCKFCGLNEIMKFREIGARDVLTHLERLEARHGITRFFSVDLIMPRDYLASFLPEIKKAGRGWSLFYEIKANVRRKEVALFAEAGLKWIQPGIESLSDQVLKLMDKGVAALQNIQLLKWCREYDIKVTWNIIAGLPGETPDAYEAMTELAPALFHLTPPSGVSPFQLHRFSPYFEDPDRYGITPKGAHPLYEHIFLADKAVLDDLVYLHDYDLTPEQPVAEYSGPLARQVRAWQKAEKDGVGLSCEKGAGGGLSVIDTRGGGKTVTRLDKADSSLLLCLDEVISEKKLRTFFQKSHPKSFKTIQARGGIAKTLKDWQERRWLARTGDCVLGLVVNGTPRVNRAGSDSLRDQIN